MALKIQNNFTPCAKYGYEKTQWEQNTVKMYKWKLVKPVTFLFFFFWLVGSIKNKKNTPNCFKRRWTWLSHWQWRNCCDCWERSSVQISVDNPLSLKRLLLPGMFWKLVELMLPLIFSRLSKLHPKGVEIRAVIVPTERSSDESKLHSLISVDNKKN